MPACVYSAKLQSPVPRIIISNHTVHWTGESGERRQNNQNVKVNINKYLHNDCREVLIFWQIGWLQIFFMQTHCDTVLQMLFIINRVCIFVLNQSYHCNTSRVNDLTKTLVSLNQIRTKSLLRKIYYEISISPEKMSMTSANNTHWLTLTHTKCPVRLQASHIFLFIHWVYFNKLKCFIVYYCNFNLCCYCLFLFFKLPLIFCSVCSTWGCMFVWKVPYKWSWVNQCTGFMLTTKEPH